MIEAKFYCGASDGSLHLEAKGHAQAGQKGRDLVCAGVSALVCTLGSAAERMYEQQMLERYPLVELEEGHARIIAVPKAGFREAALMAFWTVQVGIAELAECFPGNVTLEEVLKAA